ncbi:hypothetical protein, partial [Microbacterium sp. BF1]|uniref:hypothetical protein n=1 Tax=Microbacterium sp. BF1 TaxID=2821146 RepID=UPI001C4DEF8C
PAAVQPSRHSLKGPHATWSSAIFRLSALPMLFATASLPRCRGPFVPLIVPGRNISSADSVKGAVYNSVWEMDIAEITPAG